MLLLQNIWLAGNKLAFFLLQTADATKTALNLSLRTFAATPAAFTSSPVTMMRGSFAAGNGITNGMSIWSLSSRSAASISSL